mgnify:FL=1
MASLSAYFIKNNRDLIPEQKNIITGDKYRFSILSPRLIRIEYNKDNKFENRATSLVVKRNFGSTNFTVEQTELSLTITTEYFTLTYVKGTPVNSKNLKVKVNGTDREWYPSHKEIRNLGSINYSLDYLENNLKLDKGLYSFDGFATLDDSTNLVLENDNFIPREPTYDMYLFVYNKDLGLCLQDYFNLTGYPPMIPRYTLGTWWYKNDPYNMYDIDNILKEFYDNHLPISVFLLGDKWHNREENFAYDRTLFDTNILNKYYKSKRVKFGLTINPELPIYPKDPLFNTLSNAINNYDNKYLSFIPLNNNTISIYLNTVISNLKSTGINIFNIDYNNEKDKQGLFLLNHYHYVIANLNEVGVILSRNPGIAPHRYPIIYSGQTRVSWATLKVLPTYNNSAANLGITWHAHAIGGYYGGIEDDELYLRYIQFGVFNPIFILAGDTGKYYKREPWKWNQLNLSVIRTYMQLRNKLIPYIYNEGYNYHEYGVPLIQPLYYKYPKIYDEPNYVNQYFFGSRIMISPIIKKKNIEMNRVVQRIFIPSGTWYDYFSGKKFAGNKYYVNFYKDEDYPIFVKEGSIIPMSLDDTSDLPRNMEIQIFPAENGLYSSYELYEDDGISLNKNYNYIIIKMNLDRVENGYKFTITKKEGNLNVPNRTYLLRFKNMKNPDKIIVKYQGQTKECQAIVEKNDLLLELKDINVYEPLEVLLLGNNLEIETISVINKEIEGILDDLEIETIIKESVDEIIFSDLSINKKRIGLRKLRRQGLEPKYINMFISLLEFINQK